MHSLFNVGGFRGEDPLDKLSLLHQLLITVGTALVINTAFLYVVFTLLDVASLQYPWLFWVEIGTLSLLYAPIMMLVRKASTIVHILMLALVGMAVDLYIENGFRQQGLASLWWYNADAILGSLHPLLQIATVWLGDAIVAGPIVLWLVRLVANMFPAAPDATVYHTEEQYKAVFPDEWSRESVSRPQRQFGFYALRILGFVYAGYAALLVIALLGTSVYPEMIRSFLNMTYDNPALTINTYIKIALMVVLCFTGAFNRSVRYYASMVLLGAHAVSTLISLVFYYTTPHNSYHEYLMMSAIADTGLVILFGIIAYQSRNDAEKHRRKKEYPEYYSLANRLTQWFYLVYGGVVCAIVPGIIAMRYMLDGGQGWGAIYGFPDPQLANTITKYSTLAMLAWLIARRETLRETLGKAIVFAYMTSVVVSGLWLMIGGMFNDVLISTRIGTQRAEDWYFMLNVLMDGGVVLAILMIRKMYYTVEYTINAISPSSARAVLAMHDALWGRKTNTRLDALVAIDTHVAGMKGRKRGLLNFPFWILEHVAVTVYGLLPGFSSMDEEQQRYFLRTSILRPPDERAKAMVPYLADAFYRLGNAMHALMSLSHYTSLSVHSAIGYVAPDARGRMQSEIASAPPPDVETAQLPTGPDDQRNYRQASSGTLVAPRVVTPVSDDSLPDDVDYIIIGSGAGAAVMAYRLACEVNDPKRILIVERGRRYSPLQDFNDDEMSMVRKLYKEGGLQMSRRFDMMILQGECVGGTTVVNNAVCLRMPETIRTLWQDDFGIPLTTLDAEYDRIADELGIVEMPSLGINTKVRDVFTKGVAGFNSTRDTQHRLRDVQLYANMRSEDGNGLLNIGNKRMRKMSMLETYLPWAEGRGVHIVSNTSGVRVLAEGKHATGVLMRNKLGAMKKVMARKAVIIAGGAVSSSHVLMRSELQKSLGSNLQGNVGKYVSCNFAFPVAFEFMQPLDAFDGTQITLGASTQDGRAVFETYFNPPGAFAISLPFYFDKQAHVMNTYRHLVNFGSLVGSEANGVIQPNADIIDGRAFTWTLGKKDVSTIKYALKTLVSIGEQAGASHATIPMEPGIRMPLDRHSIESWSKALDSFDLSMENLRLTTAHPQGGNRMAAADSKYGSTRVLDETFRVAGMDNVYVVDASVFPTGITVNPQWSILALSSTASSHVLRGTL